MNGIININKPKDMTSFDVVAIVRRTLGIKKVGHTGTLDPDATGVLPVCIGRATRVCDLLLEADKAYRATVVLGSSTDTDDAAGEVLKVSNIRVSRTDVEAVLPEFTGEIDQLPPMYSAVKMGGRKLYELARKGKEVERRPRHVTIYKLQLGEFDEACQRFTLTIRCSKGTYIRALCRDLGEKLGTFAHLGELIRIKSGMFTLEDALTLDELKAFAEQGRIKDCLIPTDRVFEDLPAYCVDAEQERRIRNGNELLSYKVSGGIKAGMRMRLYSQEQEFLAVYEAAFCEEYHTCILKCVKSFFEV